MLLVALVVLLRRKVEWGKGWVWPVPSTTVNKRRYDAVISQESKDGHNGVDIMYPRLSAQDLVVQYPPRTVNGSPMHFAPPRTPVLAARAGRVWSVARTQRGWGIVIEHGGKPGSGRPAYDGNEPGFTTFYQHIETPALPLHTNGINLATGAATSVAAGQVIGFMGGDPSEATHLRHLHFEVWKDGAADHAVSPDDAMQSWPRVPWMFTP